MKINAIGIHAELELTIAGGKCGTLLVVTRWI